MKSFEHFKEKVIGQFLKLKKELNEEHTIITKKIDEYVIMIDKCDTDAQMHLVAVKSIKDLDDRINKREMKGDLI